MKPFILLNVVYTIVTLSFFDMPAPKGGYTILTYIEKHSFGDRGFGYACRLGIIYFFLILIHIGIYALILKEKKVKR
jgi:ABC-type sugar transport system permease subunit